MYKFLGSVICMYQDGYLLSPILCTICITDIFVESFISWLVGSYFILLLIIDGFIIFPARSCGSIIFPARSQVVAFSLEQVATGQNVLYFHFSSFGNFSYLFPYKDDGSSVCCM